MTYPFTFRECLLSTAVLQRIGFVWDGNHFHFRFNSKESLTIENRRGHAINDDWVSGYFLIRCGPSVYFLHEVIQWIKESYSEVDFQEFIAKCHLCGFSKYVNEYLHFLRHGDLTDPEDPIRKPSGFMHWLLSREEMDGMGLYWGAISEQRFFKHPGIGSDQSGFPCTLNGSVHLHSIMDVMREKGPNVFMAFRDLCDQHGLSEQFDSYAIFKDWRVLARPARGLSLGCDPNMVKDFKSTQFTPSSKNQPHTHVDVSTEESGFIPCLLMPEDMDKMWFDKKMDADTFRWWWGTGRWYSFPIMSDGRQYLHVIYDCLSKKLGFEDMALLCDHLRSLGWSNHLDAYLATKKEEPREEAEPPCFWVPISHLYEVKNSVLNANESRVDVRIIESSMFIPEVWGATDFEQKFVKVKIVE